MKRLVRVGSLLVIGLVIFTWTIHHQVNHERALIVQSMEKLKPAPVAFVFGARVYPDGTPSAMLQERVEAGVELYKAHKVKKLLMTGDHRRTNYDEPGTMRQMAEKAGVPAVNIKEDDAGFRTYDSLYRAQAIFGVWKAILVSESYHLPRSLYVARSLGIDVQGYPAEKQRYFGQLWRDAREILATDVAWLDLHLSRRPHFLGAKESLS